MRPSSATFAVGDNFQKHSYPWGIMINANGSVSSTKARTPQLHLAKYGRVILMQPVNSPGKSSTRNIPMLRDEYRIKQVTKVRADTLEDLVKRLDDVDANERLKRSRHTTKSCYRRRFQSERQGRARPKACHQQIELGQHDR